MLLSELHQLELWGTDIGNAYLKAHTKRNSLLLLDLTLMTWKDTFLSLTRHCMEQEYQEHVGMAAFFDVLKKMGFNPSKADPDVYMRPAEDKSCYEYMEE